MNSLQVVYRPCLHLEVKVLRGCDISFGTLQDWADTPDPYVKLCIPTAPNGTRKTKPQSNTANPIWNETFQFFLDPELENKLEITLMESDVAFDDLMGTESFNLSSLTLDKPHFQTFTFRKGSKVDVEMRVEKSTAPADMRYSIELCEQENDFCRKRKRIVIEAMSKVLKKRGPKKLDEVPTVAILGSGGGFRAMVGFSGVFCALKDMGILDCAIYTVGLSGSTWYLSTLYSHSKWPSIHPREIRNQIRDNIKDNFVWNLLSPSWLWKHYSLIADKKKRGQPVSFTDLFGYLVAETILKDRKTIPKLSEQQMAVQDGQVPLPLYSCLDVKKGVSAHTYCEWLEFSPYEIGIAKYGTFMKTEQFGSKFFCGRMMTKYEEPPLHYLQGLWGSAFAILLQRVVDGKGHPDGTIKAMKNGGDLRGELEEMIDSDNFEDDEESDVEEEVDAPNGEHQKEQPVEEENGDEGFWSGLVANLMEKFPVLKTRKGRAGLIHNFLRGLRLLASPFSGGDQDVNDGVDGLSLKAKRIFLVDAGLDFNSPYPLVLRPQRSVDVILSFDFSAREKDEQIDFQELKLAEKWAKEHNLKFPPINIEAQLDTDDIKECYVFRDPEDLECPIVVHFTLINKTFKEYSKPGVLRETEEEKEYANFPIFEDPEGHYSTFNFHYTEKSSNRLADLCEFNTLLCEGTIKDVLAESVQRKTARKVNNGKY